MYLLYIPWHFPLHKDPNIKGASLEAEEAFKNQYPAIYNHLLNFKTELSNRNQAETGIRYEWYALQRWGANYMDDFSIQKIIYIEIMTDNPMEGYEFPCFALDYNKSVALNTAYIMTGDINNLKYILGILNSNTGRYLSKLYSLQLQQNQYRMLNQYVSKFPIPINKDYKESIIKLVDKITEKRLLIDEINLNEIVYKIFNFSLNEIEFINCQ